MCPDRYRRRRPIGLPIPTGPAARRTSTTANSSPATQPSIDQLGESHLGDAEEQLRRTQRLAEIASMPWGAPVNTEGEKRDEVDHAEKPIEE